MKFASPSIKFAPAGYTGGGLRTTCCALLMRRAICDVSAETGGRNRRNAKNECETLLPNPAKLFFCPTRLFDMSKLPEEAPATWIPFMDLRVPLSVEIGRTRLKLREILQLEAGSVVKLSRSIGEGVGVYSDDQLLLRGEIVVIEDLAGVRVGEILAQNMT